MCILVILVVFLTHILKVITETMHNFLLIFWYFGLFLGFGGILVIFLGFGVILVFFLGLGIFRLFFRFHGILVIF